VTIFVSTLWRAGKSFEEFIEDFIWVVICERICLERAFNKCRMKNRCKPVCKVGPVADAIMLALEDEGLFNPLELYIEELEEVREHDDGSKK